MAKTNAQRQADFRKRGKAARALIDGIGESGLSRADELILDRLFGLRLALADNTVRRFVEEATTVAKGVDSKGAVGEPAIDVLLQSVMHNGLGGQPLGWSLERDGEWQRLQIHIAKPLAKAA